jgi:hypothetical protein
VNWALVTISSAGSGAIGAAVTTYSTQAKERRAARAEVRAFLQRVEQLARRIDTTAQGYHAQLVAVLDDLQGAMLAAGLPYYLAAFYADVRLLAYATHITETPEQRRLPRSHSLVAGRVAYQTAVLLAKVIWHPWLSAPTRRWRIRRLQRTLDSGMPDRARFRQSTRHELRKWERSLRQPEPGTSAEPFGVEANPTSV